MDSPDQRDPTDELLADLFAAVPKTAPEPFRKQRVYTAVVARRDRGAARSLSRGLRWAIVGGSLALGTAAAATVAQQVRSFLNEPTAPPPTATGSTASPAVPVERTPAESTTPNLGSERPTAPSAFAPAEPKPVPRQSVASDDPTLVAQAIQALRNQHQPAKARLLLTQYLRTYPRGALAEEALALSIEAANAAKDPDAVTLACKYLAAYPRGRHRALASRACGRGQVEK